MVSDLAPKPEHDYSIIVLSIVIIMVKIMIEAAMENGYTRMEIKAKNTTLINTKKETKKIGENGE